MTSTSNDGSILIETNGNDPTPLSDNQVKQTTEAESAREGDIDPEPPRQRPGDHISWDEYFMSVAQLAAYRSKDPSTKVGACIVNSQNKIVATGYNGMPNGVHDDLIPWSKHGPYLETKYAYVVHAELNAILNSVLTDQTNCRLYVSLFPCNECAKAIIQTGIKEVIYVSDKHKEKDSTKASKRMFKLAGVRCQQFTGKLIVQYPHGQNS